MAKKILNWPVLGVVFVVLITLVNLNATANMDGASAEGEFNTDKTDRMLIKEIYANQQEELALLREIKSLVQSKR